MPLRTTFITTLCALAAVTSACSSESGNSDYIDINQVSVRQPQPNVGTWQIDCGTNENEHRNADNVVAQPKLPAGAHHVHDYVGNVSTNAFSTNDTLEASATTCQFDDKSTYYWPVLRLVDEPGHDAHSPGGGIHGNHGRILRPHSVVIQFRGNAVSNVVAMPRFLRAITGNPVAVSQNGEHTARVQWTCSGDRTRVTNRYPRCGAGQQVVRIFDFPSCWDGLQTDSELHRSHLTFPNGDACRVGTFPVPQLHIEVSYAIPPGARYAIDSFPEEGRKPLTDHAMFIGVLPAPLMTRVVECVNSRRTC
ncbi:DUF1996 domain-containing protein [Kibdelosporangium aridum]|uniref:DUF1996 domain-containing protein n=1 Tax=Kibdelosporangium aridum TaxID=2030 RepID=UPI0035EBB602